MIRSAVLALATVFAVAQGGMAARGEDPDWPCPQRLVPRLDAGSLWSGAASSAGAWQEVPEVTALVTRIAPRMVTEATGLQAIEDFSAPLKLDARKHLLPFVFYGVLEETNRQRSELIERIKAFARRQRELAEAVKRLAAERDALPAKSADIDELEQRRFYAAKSFQDAERTLRYACDMPVQLEARLGAYARALQAALGKD